MALDRWPKTVHSGMRAVLVALLFVAACSSQDLPRQYSDEELGVDRVVDEWMQDSIPFAQYRTLEEWDEALDRELPNLLEDSGHERDRGLFEVKLQLIVALADDSSPADVARGSGVLHDAVDEAMDDCAAEAGWPGVQLYDVSSDMGEQYERDFGLTLEMFLDLRHECSKYAATYPTLDPVYRDELLAKRRAHYMEVARDWIAANPGLVVPVEHHEGDNHPHEDSVIEACLEFDDPEVCAREERVTLP